jgi:integrase
MTIIGYRSLCKHQIFPRWGGQRIDRMLPEYIEDGYGEMLAGGLAPSTIKKIHAVLSSAYEIEVKRGNVARNPCQLVEPPQLPQSDKAALSIGQARAVLAEAESRRNAERWSTGLACGLRQAEALGLRWPFLDIDGPDGMPGAMRVWYQLQRLPWLHGCADPAACCEPRHRRPCPKRCPKVRPSGRRHTCVPPGAKGLCKPGCTGHAAQCPERAGGGLVFREIKERRRKTIPVAWPLVLRLRAHRERQAWERMVAGDLWEDSGVVFAQENGRPLDYSADWKQWSGILAAAGVPHVGTHGMRHSAATIGLDEGTALAVVQELLGHSDIRVTRGYTHVSTALAADGAERVGRALFGATATKTATGGPPQ